MEAKKGEEGLILRLPFPSLSNACHAGYPTDDLLVNFLASKIENYAAHKATV